MTVGVAPAVVLESARAQLVALDDRLVTGFDDVDLVEGLAAVQTLKGTVAALEARLLAEADTRDLARKQLHWGSTTDWFTHLAGPSRDCTPATSAGTCGSPTACWPGRCTRGSPGRLCTPSPCEGSIARTRARPDIVSDLDLSREVADAVEAMPGEELWADTDNASGVRQELVARGWALQGLTVKR